mgnify:CR=1 FL=1|jgi:hypothetical protein
MSFKYAGPRDKKVLGRDFNFFEKLSFSKVDFSDECDIIITFPTNTVTFQLESGGPIEYSFNGNKSHGDMATGKASASLTFSNRTVTKIWFKGTGVVRIEAWG